MTEKKFFFINRKKKEILWRRKEIMKIVFPYSTKDPILSLEIDHLYTLFTYYDEFFFQDYFFSQYDGEIVFSLSQRMTKSAGKIFYPRNIHSLPPEDVKIEIRMAIEVFLNLYGMGGEKEVNGIKTSDPLEAFLLVFEHELCHLIEIVFFHKSSCRGKRFMEIAKYLFGHTDVYHKLPLGRDLAKEVFGLKIGDTVSFTYNRKTYLGFINRITKRASVVVSDPAGNYLVSGIPSSIYYVPLSDLQKIDGVDKVRERMKDR